MKDSDFRKIYDDAIMMPLDRQLLLVTDEVRMAVPPIVLLGQLKWSLHNRISTDRLRPLIEVLSMFYGEVNIDNICKNTEDRV